MTDSPFNADDPIAFFITWTCYGTWIPGDERGWHQWSKGMQPPNDFFKITAEANMKEPEFLLSKDDGKIVELTVKKHCEIRGWTLH
jgi:hypothetical protein